MNDLIVFNKTLIEKEFSWPLASQAIEQCFIATSAKRIVLPLRSFLPLENAGGSMGIMPGITPDIGVCGAKLLTLIPKNSSRNIPTIQGLVTICDQNTGEVMAVFDAQTITAIRTAAASAVATKLLSKPKPTSLGIMGTSVQCLSHARAITAILPTIRRIKIWGRSKQNAEAVSLQLSDELNRSVEVQTISDTIESDIVCCVTGSAGPLFEASDAQKGTHFNLVGSHTPNTREAPSELISGARLFVDHREAALSEAGDILIPIDEGAISENHILGEIGDLLMGSISGRETASDITVFKSLGNAAQDLFLAHALYEKYRSRIAD